MYVHIPVHPTITCVFEGGGVMQATLKSCANSDLCHFDMLVQQSLLGGVLVDLFSTHFYAYNIHKHRSAHIFYVYNIHKHIQTQ